MWSTYIYMHVCLYPMLYNNYHIMFMILLHSNARQTIVTNKTNNELIYSSLHNIDIFKNKDLKYYTSYQNGKK